MTRSPSQPEDEGSSPDPIEPHRFREVLGHFPTGVAVITAPGPQGPPVGMAVGSFASVSLDPPLVAFFPAKTSSSWIRIQEAGVFCVNILSVKQEPVCRAFAMSGEDKFAGLAWREGVSGSPIIDEVVGWIDCSIEAVHDAGDHFIVIGRVMDLAVERPTLPLLFFQGGYGGFATTSLVTGAADDLLDALRIADRARGHMEAVADAVDADCLAHAVSGPQVVLVAHAPCLRCTETPPGTGVRFPMVPPWGEAFAAWLPSAAQERWLSDLRVSIEERDETRERLRQINRHGWAYTVRSENPDNVAEALDMVRELGQTPAVERELARLIQRNGMRGDPAAFTQMPAGAVRTIGVPVLDEEGHLALMLSLHNLNPALRGADLLPAVERLQQAAAATSEWIRSQRPARP